jgi:hypothetical protein
MVMVLMLILSLILVMYIGATGAPLAFLLMVLLVAIAGQSR